MGICDRPNDPRRYWHCLEWEQWNAFTWDQWYGFLWVPFDEWTIPEFALASVCGVKGDVSPRVGLADVFNCRAAQIVSDTIAGVFAGEGKAGVYIVREGDKE